MGKYALGCLAAAVIGAVIVGLAGLGIYNGLVSRSEAVDAQWAQVENVYQRRADLVPNLVATVQGAARFEQSTLTAVTEARASVGQVKLSGAELVNNPQAFARWEQAQAGLTSALQRLLVVAEAYPDLKATQGFRDLQVQLEGTENRIARERQVFNETALAYNSARKQFPTVLLANMFGFGEKAYFKAQAGADQAPKVQFDFGQSQPSPSPAR
jgi:LemA protein